MTYEIEKPGLYIHIPFCRSKCPYCGFYSIVSSSLIEDWLTALKKEIELYKGTFSDFDSIYFGGGTPSLLEIGDIENILECIYKHFDIADGPEISVEVNPGDLNDRKISGLRYLGINRVNVGVQSFDNDILSFLGRRHSGAESESVLELLHSSGFDNIGIDLIYGINGQTLEKWSETLKKAVMFKPEHISCYELSIEEKTPFWRMKEKGEIRSLDEAAELSFFCKTSEFLEKNGYIHYEVSNFARGEQFFSRHNSKYWVHTPYLGLGPSAHSFRDSRRWWNYRSIRKYCKALEQDKFPIEDQERLSDEQLKMEIISLGLRTRAGIDMAEIGESPQIMRIISQLKDSGHVEVWQGRIVPTKKGYLISDHLPLYFL